MNAHHAGRKQPATGILVRNTLPEDFDAITRLSRAVYPDQPPWTARTLAAQHEAFPEGQFVAVDTRTGEVVGMAASLIVAWDDYDHRDDYATFTAEGRFSNHDPSGRTLYGAEVMVHPAHRRRRIGARIYAARRALVERLGLLRIRAGARLPNYHRYADRLTPEAYVLRVIRGELRDPTLSFQLRQGFEVIDVIPEYFRHDPQSRGCAALIEWLNRQVARPEDYAGRNPRFLRPDTPRRPRRFGGLETGR